MGTLAPRSDRRTGVGCDQLIAIATSEVADARMTIRNADGSMAEACGNGGGCAIWPARSVANNKPLGTKGAFREGRERCQQPTAHCNIFWRLREQARDQIAPNARVLDEANSHMARTNIDHSRCTF
jgi:hypothetical protein